VLQLVIYCDLLISLDKLVLRQPKCTRIIVESAHNISVMHTFANPNLHKFEYHSTSLAFVHSKMCFWLSSSLPQASHS
jgi:hypothetical protein